MVSKDEKQKMQCRRKYKNNWQTSLMKSMLADAPFCCFAFFCPPCASYLLRKRALGGDMTRYSCCGGYEPCSGRCGERRCPEFCLATEVLLCFRDSVDSTRHMLQDEFQIGNTKCDECIFGFKICIDYVACICCIVSLMSGGDNFAEKCLPCLFPMVYCMFCACMQTQHKVEMDHRDRMTENQRGMAVPPAQQMSRIKQSIPSSVGYAPQARPATDNPVEQEAPPQP